MILKFIEFIKEARSKNNNELKIDEILDKISSNGIDSLSDYERDFLNGDIGADEVGVDLYDVDEYNFIDDSGNYIDDLDKSKFILKVVDMDEVESYITPKGGMNYTEVLVYDKSGKYQVEVHFSDMLFPELKKINLEDLDEGSMEYYGKLNTEQLIDKLKNMGFNAIKK